MRAMPDGTIPSLAAAHLRLGRAAVGIYSAAAALALSLLVASLYTEHSHTQGQLEKQVLVQAEDRAHALQNHLELLSRELRRLGLRCYLAVPMLVDGELTGALTLWYSTPGKRPAQETDVAREIAALDRLSCGGIAIGNYRTLPCRARLLDPAPDIPPRDPPIRFRKHVPDAWIALELTEGKNRQVRRMTAAVGHPTLRLLRVRIGHFSLGDLSSGSWRELNPAERATVSSA